MPSLTTEPLFTTEQIAAKSMNLTNGKVRGVPTLPTVKFGKRIEARESETRSK
jgi:hypothetical protein